MYGPRKPIDNTLRRCLICFNSNKISSSDIYYFQLPSDPGVAAQWFRNLNRNELVKHLFQKNYALGVWICSEHFAKSAIRINPLDNTDATLDPAALPLVVKPDKILSTVILSPADRNLLFCRRTPVDTELSYFRQQFNKYQQFKLYRIHCTTCDAHINLAPINKDQIQVHRFLKVIQCDKCFHCDGSNGPLPVNKDLVIKCQCGVANTLLKCYCSAIFCKVCNWKNTDDSNVVSSKCLWCTPAVTLDLRALQWAVFKVLDFKYKSITTNEKYKNYTTERIQKLLEKDLAGCCGNATVSSVPRKSAKKVEQPSITVPPSFQVPSKVNIVKHRRPTETQVNNVVPIKKIIVCNPVGVPVAMDKPANIANDNIIPNSSFMPPLTRISNVVAPEKIPIISSVASIAVNEIVPAPSVPIIDRVVFTAPDKFRPIAQKPNVKLLTPVKNYSKKPPNAIGPHHSKKYRPRAVLDDRCLQIKSNFKNNGTFLKTLCDHFMFRVENMQHTESTPSNLHQQLISAIGDICDKLESIKEKCMQDLQKCSEIPVSGTPVLPTLPMLSGPPETRVVGENEQNDFITVPSVEPTAIISDNQEKPPIACPLLVSNEEEEDEEEVYELYDIIDTDFPECDVSHQDSDDDGTNPI